MSYQVLARQWRPHNFKEMVGQEHVLRMLIHALDTQRLHHAYLFTGTRGVGKTTIARIFAKCLNCEKGVSSTPCEKCSACTSINEGCFLDLIEVDAASRTKVEDTRDLLENVMYTPTQGRYKVYLIDEVHMLSGHSFNALLKTLEEPPEHVKFLLATTDPQKLPITVLSRCLQFNLKRISEQQIAHQLRHILNTEKISYEETALTCLSQAADGSMRDALSLLDQAIAYGKNEINTSDVHQMLGTIERDYVYQLIEILAKKNANKLLETINLIAEQTTNFENVLDETIDCFHQLAICHASPEFNKQPEKITQLSQAFSAEELQLNYQIGLIGRRDLPLAINPKSGFEMIMLRMLAFYPMNTQQNAMSNSPQNNTSQAKQASVASAKDDEWSSIVQQLKLGGMCKALANHCELLKLDDNKIELSIGNEHNSLLINNNDEKLKQAIQVYYGKPMQVIIHLQKAEGNSPAKQQKQKQDAAYEKTLNNLNNDKNVQEIITTFDATLDTSSISINVEKNC